VNLHWGEVDGVPAVWGELPGPVTAMLAFRVGRADETLARSGVGHLVQHLVLHRYGEDPDRSGFVDLVETGFYQSGDGAEIAGFFGRLCDRLATLPVDRLEAEKQVLRAEQATEKRPLDRQLAGRRHGAMTYGLVAYRELGLPAIGAADVLAWRGRYLTAGNAVLVLTSPPPPGLRLSLAAGPRRPAPAPTDVLPATPAWFGTPLHGIAVDLVLDVGDQAVLVASLLERRLQRVLRFEQGISHAPWARYRRYQGDHGHVVVVTDALPDNYARVRDGVVAVLQEMATIPPSGAELDEAKQRYVDVAATRQGKWAHLERAGFDLLQGRPFDDVVERTSQLLATSPEAIPAMVSGALSTALATVPDGLDMPDSWVKLPDTSPVAVRGKEHRSVGQGYPRTPEALAVLVSGTDGLTLDRGSSRSTVLYERCAATLRWPDGQRTLVGDDGTVLRVEPNLWHRGVQVTASVDRHVPPDRVVPMPARPPEEIPGPPFYVYVPNWGYAGVIVAGVVLLVVNALLYDTFGPVRTSVVRGTLGAVAFLMCTGGLSALLVRAVNAAERRRLRRRAEPIPPSTSSRPAGEPAASSGPTAAHQPHPG
jgi:predicted Zn-dependent peptidase